MNAPNSINSIYLSISPPLKVDRSLLKAVSIIGGPVIAGINFFPDAHWPPYNPDSPYDTKSNSMNTIDVFGEPLSFSCVRQLCKRVMDRMPQDAIYVLFQREEEERAKARELGEEAGEGRREIDVNSKRGILYYDHRGDTLLHTLCRGLRLYHTYLDNFVLRCRTRGTYASLSIITLYPPIYPSFPSSDIPTNNLSFFFYNNTTI